MENASLGRTLLVGLLLVAVLFAGQSGADRMAVSTSPVETGLAMGRATFAYLSGLRVFAAQVLWNRIEPLFHGYYEAIPLYEQSYMLPTLNAINILDPQFQQPYYIAPWILARRGMVPSALDVARRGVDNNPNSGLLRASYAQVVAIYGEDLDLAHEQARLAATDRMQWIDEIEQHDSYQIIRSILKQAGDEQGAEEILIEIERLDALIGDDLPAGGHDHDGDGTPDH
ncbi:MAG: hypothetical protein ACYC6C_11710 [Coriobacteriia bacterium]